MAIWVTALLLGGSFELTGSPEPAFSE